MTENTTIATAAATTQENPAMFQWTITQDTTATEKATMIGYADPEDSEDLELPVDTARYYFTLHTDDGERTYNGIARTTQAPDEEFITSPLIEFAGGYSGIVSIRWRSHPEWTRYWGYNILPSID